MKRTRLRLAAITTTVLTGVLLGGLASEVQAQTTIGTFEGSIPIETIRGEGSAINRIVVQAEEPGEVVMVFDDVILSEQGSWQQVELGSTPYTLQDLIAPFPAVIRYEGDMVGTRQEIDVELRASGLDDAPRAGFVTYTFVPDSSRETQGTVGIRQSVATRVRIGAWPPDLEGIPAAIAVSELRLFRDREQLSSPIDALLPNLPRVINRGPATVAARTTNVGEVLVQSETTLVLSRLPWRAALPFIRPDGFTLITYIDRPRLLLPTESRNSQVASTASLIDGEELDRLPVFGLVRVTATSTAFLGATRDEASASATYLVAPWKELLVLILVYRGAVYAWRRYKTVREGTATDLNDSALVSSESSTGGTDA
jgi:hypothetical protein